MVRLAAFILLGAGCLVAQGSSNSITVTATRNNAAAPDLVAFTVAVDTPLTMTRDDVIAALQGSGIGLANFTSVYTSWKYGADNSQIEIFEWSFNVTAPITGLKDAIGTLNALQTSVAKNGLTLSYTIQGLQTSAAAQAAQTCSQAGLISDAREQAQTIAAAASMRVLSIVSMASSVSTVAPAGCSLTVKFSLGPAI